MSAQIRGEWRGSGERPSDGTSRSQRAVVRLLGVPEIPPETLLAMVEGLRRVLRLVGVVNVHIQLEVEDRLSPEGTVAHTHRRGRVLFLCTGNSARSQMAESLVNHHLGGQWEAHSGGSAPAGYVYPLAVEVLSEIGVRPSGLHSKSVDAFRGQSFDLVVTLCGDAEECPVWLGGGALVHMSFPDPAAGEGTRAERLEAFRRIRDAIAREVLALLRPSEVSRALDPSFVHR